MLPDATDATWARIALAPEAWDGLGQLLPALPAAARVVVWNALQLAVAEAELDPRTALGIVAAAAPEEAEDTLLAPVLGWAGATLVGAYLGDPAAGDLLAETAGRALAAAPPGSARALAALRAAIASTRDVAAVRRWRDGVLPAGTAPDTDLRWRLLARLCALGAAGPDEVDAALVDDESSEGAEWAARCRAALPDAAAKAAAWQLLTVDRDCPNSLLYATARGFWQPGQTALTAGYVPRYFAEIADTARFRSGWLVQRVASLAYPWPVVTPDTLRRTERLLAEPGLHHGVRRAVLDCGDDLRRALAARRRFGAGEG